MQKRKEKNCWEKQKEKDWWVCFCR
jgi:hypothetical protein